MILGLSRRISKNIIDISKQAVRYQMRTMNKISEASEIHCDWLDNRLQPLNVAALHQFKVRILLIL
jgi:hypothetical protein